MINKIQLWLTRICGAEGGYVNDSDDPGGETKWGISKHSYPYIDIPSLSINDACIIYNTDFIQPLTKASLPDSITYQLLDFAVNSGMSAAIKCIQKELNLNQDGFFGPKTREAIFALAETALVMKIIAARLDFMSSLSTWPIYSRGWVHRMTANLRYGALDT